MRKCFLLVLIIFKLCLSTYAGSNALSSKSQNVCDDNSSNESKDLESWKKGIENLDSDDMERIRAVMDDTRVVPIVVTPSPKDVYDAKAMLIEAILSGKFNDKNQLSIDRSKEKKKKKDKKLKPRPTYSSTRKTTSSKKYESDESTGENVLYHTEAAYRKPTKGTSGTRRDFDESTESDRWKHKLARKRTRTAMPKKTSTQKKKTRGREHETNRKSKGSKPDSKPYKHKSRGSSDESRTKTEKKKGKPSKHRSRSKTFYSHDKSSAKYHSASESHEEKSCETCAHRKPYVKYFPVPYKKTLIEKYPIDHIKYNVKLGPKKNQNLVVHPYVMKYDQFDTLFDFDDYFVDASEMPTEHYIKYQRKPKKSTKKKNKKVYHSDSLQSDYMDNYDERSKYSKEATNNKQKNKNYDQNQSQDPWHDDLLDDYFEKSNDVLAEQYMKHFDKLKKTTKNKNKKSYKNSSNKNDKRKKSTTSKKSKSYRLYDLSVDDYNSYDSSWSGPYKQTSKSNKHGRGESRENLSLDSRWNKKNKGSYSNEDYSDHTPEWNFQKKYLDKGHGKNRSGKSRSSTADKSKSSNNRRNHRHSENNASEDNSFAYESQSDEFFPDFYSKRHYRSLGKPGKSTTISRHQSSSERSWGVEVDVETQVSRSNFIPTESISIDDDQSYVNAKAADVSTSTPNIRGPIIDHVATSIWQNETILSSLLSAAKKLNRPLVTLVNNSD